MAQVRGQARGGRRTAAASCRCRPWHRGLRAERGQGRRDSVEEAQVYAREKRRTFWTHCSRVASSYRVQNRRLQKKGLLQKISPLTCFCYRALKEQIHKNLHGKKMPAAKTASMRHTPSSLKTHFLTKL
eukprot:04731_5